MLQTAHIINILNVVDKEYTNAQIYWALPFQILYEKEQTLPRLRLKHLKKILTLSVIFRFLRKELYSNLRLSYITFFPQSTVYWPSGAYYYSKGIVFLPQTKILWFQCLCNLMVQTFDISNLNYFICKYNLFEISKVYGIGLQRLENQSLWQKLNSFKHLNIYLTCPTLHVSSTSLVLHFISPALHLSCTLCSSLHLSCTLYVLHFICPALYMFSTSLVLHFISPALHLSWS